VPCWSSSSPSAAWRWRWSPPSSLPPAGVTAYNFLITITAMVGFTFDGDGTAVRLAHAADAVGAVVGGVAAPALMIRAGRRLDVACAAFALALPACPLAPPLASRRPTADPDRSAVWPSSSSASSATSPEYATAGTRSSARTAAWCSPWCSWTCPAGASDFDSLPFPYGKRPEHLITPHTILLAALFKIVDGRIREIEALMVNVALGTTSGWEGQR
jgi:hypothetical protein